MVDCPEAGLVEVDAPQADLVEVDVPQADLVEVDSLVALPGDYELVELAQKISAESVAQGLAVGSSETAPHSRAHGFLSEVDPPMNHPTLRQRGID